MIDYELAINIINITFSVVIVAMLCISWYYVAGFFLSFKKIKRAPHSTAYTKFAVLVPARNESKVVGNIMVALNNQTYPKDRFDVWFIVESESDPTYQLALDNGYYAFVRDELTEQRKTKGFALQECIRYFKKNEIRYDAYMIFDADNVMDPDYLEKMNDLRQSGVEVGVGYRNFTNANTNWLTSCSAILFTYLNSFASKNRTILFKKALLSGTGYYINSEIIDEAGGWIFTGLTEDTELTRYCLYHDINMRYYPGVNFYDEQSSSLKMNHYQHIRWVWGFIEKKKPFIVGGKNHHATSKITNNAAKFEYTVGMFPFIGCVAIDAILSIVSLALFFASLHFNPAFSMTLLGYFFMQIGILYFLMSFVAATTIISNFNKLKLSFWTIVWSILTYFFYVSDLIIAFFHGLFSARARKTWKPIKHSGKIKDKRAKKVSKNEKE